MGKLHSQENRLSVTVKAKTVDSGTVAAMADGREVPVIPHVQRCGLGRCFRIPRFPGDILAGATGRVLAC